MLGRARRAWCVPCRHVRTGTTISDGGGSLPRGHYLIAPRLRDPPSARWARFVGHGKAAIVVLKSCWHMLVGGEFGGAQ
jgi:hypothetical protein